MTVESVLTRIVDETPVVEDEVTAPPLDDEAVELLAKAGLDHVPTIDEAKALLDARRREIRHAVMVEADKRNWCEDGTRKVCANLRLERPGSRAERSVEVEVTLKITHTIPTYTNEGAVAQMLDKGILSPDWLKSHLYVRGVEVQPQALTVDGTAIDVTALVKEKPEVTA
jgi:hypothetical protein